MTAENLTEVPREHLPRLVDSIIDGKASIYFCMKAHSQYEFLVDGVRWPSHTGRYELKHPDQIVDELRRLYRGQGQGGISLPEILDHGQRTQYVVRTDDDGWSPDVEGNWQQGINLVRFPYDQFQVEWLEPSKKTSEPRGPAGQLAKEYLDLKPNGNLAGLRAWVADRYRGTRVKVDGKWYLQWVDYLGAPQTSPEKTFSNLLSTYRNKTD